MPTFAIGVDLGGTNLRVAAVDETGKLLEKVTSGTEVARRRSNMISRPERQVRMMVNTIAPMTSGNQPPSATLSSVADR